MRLRPSSRLRRLAENFYLGHRTRVSVGVTTLMVTLVTLIVTTALQLIFGPRFDRGFWIGIGLSVALPLLITPPVTGVIVRLVHQLRRANELAYTLANVDDLTKFKTRRRFLIEAADEIERATLLREPLVLLMLDIDQFKQINDEYGHLTGDRVLSEVAGACRRTLGPDDIMARLGGDELAVMLTGATLDNGADMAERVRAAVAGLEIDNHVPGSSDARTVAVTVSIGAAPFHPGQSLDELFMYADQALYRAKTDGRNRLRLSEPLASDEPCLHRG